MFDQKSMLLRRLSITAVVLAITVALACGGGGVETTPTGPQEGSPAAGELRADPALLQKALGTTENVDPLVLAAIARASMQLSPQDRELAFRCWRDFVCDTGRGNLTVALADGFGENVWRRITHMEFVLQALSYPQVRRIIYTSARGDPSKAISDMQSLIAQRVDIIVTFPDAGEALLPTVREATRQGIIVVPYIAALGGQPGRDYLTFVAEDLCELGKQFAEFVLQQSREDVIEVVMLGGTPGNQLSASWQRCAEQQFTGNSRVQVLGKADTNWTQEGTFQAMSSFLARYSDIDAILYEYSDGFRGGVRAYQAANRPLDVILTLRTDEQGLFCDWEQVNNPNFRIFFSAGGTFQVRIALTAAMEKKLNNRDVPGQVVVPFRMRQVERGMCNSELPAETPFSTLVPADVLRDMFRR